MTSILLPQGKQFYTTAAGAPLVGGKVYTYYSGTATPLATYADAAQVSANANPTILDARGEASIYWNGAYKVVLKDSVGNTVWTADPVSASGGGLMSNLHDPPFNAAGDGVADDTHAFTMAVTVAPGSVGSTKFSGYSVGPGTYNLTGMSCPSYKGISLTGQGSPILFALPGTVNMFEWQPDSTFALGFRKLEGMTFNGNNVAGVTCVKIGGTGVASSILGSTLRDVIVQNADVGIDDYSTQISGRWNTRAWYCDIGLYIRADPTNGGATVIEYDKADIYNCEIGMLIDNVASFALSTTCTSPGAGLVLTNVVVTTGIANGMQIKGPSLQTGTTIASFTATTITLSQAPLYPMANAKVPILISNGLQYPVDGNNLHSVAIQAGKVAAISMFGVGFNLPVTLHNLHAENNHDALYVTDIVKNGRTVKAGIPIQLTASAMALTGDSTVGETVAGAALISMTAGSMLRLESAALTPGSLGALVVSGGYFDTIEAYGTFPASGRYDAAFTRWPDLFTTASTFIAAGVSQNVIGSPIPNEYCAGGAINPRVPALTNPVGGCTLSVVIDAARGPVAKSIFTNAIGNTGSNAVYINALPNGVTNGDTVLIVMDVRADSWATMGVYLLNSSVNGTLPITPFWQRIVVAGLIQVTAGAASLVFYPTAVEAAAVALYYNNIRAILVPAGQNIAQMQAMVREGVWNDGNQNGALVGVKTAFDPPNLLAGTTVDLTTVAIPGIRVGDYVSVTPSRYDVGIEWSGICSANDTVTIRQRNFTAAAIDLMALDLRVEARGKSWA